MKRPLVSVLMTAYNREKFIAEAIESVLSSTYENFELIIVDDGSTDNTVSIARKYEKQDPRVKVYVNERNLGDYSNRNKAASFAKGKYLKYLDSDDLIYDFGLEIFVRYMEAHPEVGLGISGRANQYEVPFPVIVAATETYRRHFFVTGFLDYGPTGTILRKDVFDAVGGFSGKRMIGDMECWLKIAANYPVMMLPASLVYWRQHDGQEFYEGMKTTMYLEMTMVMIAEALSRPDCPLTDEEKNSVLEYYRKVTARGLLRLSLVKRQPARAFALYRQLGLRFRDILNALFLMNQSIKL